MEQQQEHVILVDESDRPIGSMEKMLAHREGKLHRAFSIFIFNSEGELLIHQRAADKYHSGSLWTNTCCSHPRQGEETIAAAHRRLREEMGMVCNLEPLLTFIYKAELDHDLIEHELDHVFIGHSDTAPEPNPAEVAAYRYVPMAEIKTGIEQSPDDYTAWFKIIFDRVHEHVMSSQ